MSPRIRLLAALALVALVGLVVPPDTFAQRHPPSGAVARSGVAVPRTYHSGGYHPSGGYHGGYGGHYHPYYYRPYYYSRYYYPYYAPYYYPGFTFGIGFSWGWPSYGYGYYGYGYPYPYPYPYPSAYPPPSAGYGYYGGPNTMQAQPYAPPQQQQPQQQPQSYYPASPSAPPAQYSTTQNGSFGTLSLRVTPTDATILVDGQVWDRPQGQDRFSIDLVEGTHRVEVREQGYGPYTRTVQIHAGGTLTLNVSLTNGGGGSAVQQLAVRRTVPLR
jgi:hypothetical protein